MKSKRKTKVNPLATIMFSEPPKHTRIKLGHGNYKKNALPLSDGTR